MRRIASFLISAFILASVAFCQNATKGDDKVETPIQGKSKTEVVDEVWRIATQGGLLTADGWSKACGLYTNPVPFPGNKEILVVSNQWGPAYDFKGDGTQIEVGYAERGKIDSELRYTPPRKTEFIGTAFQYHLIAVPSYLMTYGPDGKTLIKKTPAGYRGWQIQGSPGTPWTTVNTAIRYVLEMRMKTEDAALKKNADETISKLLKLN
jgi:hypothetical protein